MPPRYFFHLTNGENAIRDDEGLDFADLEAAVASALKAIDELRADGSSLAEDWRGWQLEIADGSGRTMCTPPLDHPGRERPRH